MANEIERVSLAADHKTLAKNASGWSFTLVAASMVDPLRRQRQLFGTLSEDSTMKKIPVPLWALLTLLIPFTSAAYADEGVTNKKVLVGMSSVFTGPASSLGLEVKRGVDTYFGEVNAKGGVHGRKLELLALDDGYEPKRTAPNMRTLIEQHQVFGVLGNVGTPTAVVSVPIANEFKIPFFGAFTGAGVLRKTPPDRYIINYRASYNQEADEMIRGLTEVLKIAPEEIAFFTQNDAYGDAVYSGAMKALKKRGVKNAAKLIHARYQRNTTNVEDALSRMFFESKIVPKAIIMVGTYKACGKFIRMAKEEEFEALFLNVSFVGSEALQADLGKYGENTIVTQVVPSLSEDVPAVRDYHKAIGPSPTFAALEGYLAAKAFVAALELTGKNLSREAFIDALESGRAFDIGLGRSHTLSKDVHQINQVVYPTVLQNGAWETLDWETFKR